MTSGEFVFGYGSLAVGAQRTARPQRWVHLTGMRREWNVAMDNSLTIPGYKYYVEAATGARPSVFVAFLNLVEDPKGSVNGALIALGPGELDGLDQRERNYQRVDVTRRLAAPAPGRVWAYLGRDEARARFEQALGAGRAVVAQAYHAGVRAGFEEAGRAALEAFERSTAAPRCPVVDLVRVDVP